MTPMHFQLLLGLCCLRVHPEAIEMVLGDKVLDRASGSKRDVDVTISFKESDGTQTAFIGYEAKMHSHKLDVADVEQLCIKLNDMQDLTTRAIDQPQIPVPGVMKVGVRESRMCCWNAEVG